MLVFIKMDNYILFHCSYNWIKTGVTLQKSSIYVYQSMIINGYKNKTYIYFIKLKFSNIFLCPYYYLLTSLLLNVLKILFIYLLIFIFLKTLFLERGEGRDKERERNIYVWLPLTHPLLRIWPTTQACALTGNGTSDPLVHRLALNPLSHTS